MDKKKAPQRPSAKRPPAKRTTAKKTAAKRASSRKTAGRRVSRKKPSAVPVNLLLLAVIFGFSAMLLTIRFLLVAPQTVQPPVPMEQTDRAPVEDITVPVRPDPPRAVPEQSGPAGPGKTPAERPPAEQPLPAPPVIAPAAPPEKPVEKKGTVFFVFDDAGHNLAQLQPFLDLPFDCTIAVLPGLRYSAEAARRVRSSGKDCILHQPMQAVNLSINPGPAAIRDGMQPDEIRRILRKNIEEVAPVSGINNHEGSLITADRTAMSAVLDIASEYGLYFLDSRTTAETVVPALAQEKNIRIWERAVFLDNSQDRESIMEAVSNGMKIAERRGSAVMIGHIWSNELADILREMYPEMVSQGFSLSAIARVAVHGEDKE